jgi:hypothetical protein
MIRILSNIVFASLSITCFAMHVYYGKKFERLIEKRYPEIAQSRKKDPFYHLTLYTAKLLFHPKYIDEFNLKDNDLKTLKIKAIVCFVLGILFFMPLPFTIG